MEELPDETILLIFSFLSISEIYMFSLVNKKYSRISQDNKLWEILCLKNFSPFKDEIMRTQNWKQYYYEKIWWTFDITVCLNNNGIIQSGPGFDDYNILGTRWFPYRKVFIEV
jgi:hypothetical protein